MKLIYEDLSPSEYFDVMCGDFVQYWQSYPSAHEF